MKDMIDTRSVSGVSTSPVVLSKRQGVGMAVAFDWGLAVQMLVTPFLPLVLGRTFMPLALITLLPAVLIAVFGEGVRRGWRWTRLIQFVFNALGFLGGLLVLVSVWNGIRQGNYWPVVTAVILVIFSPLIAWGMSRPHTKRWFESTDSTKARRHGGAWPFLIAIWAIVGGVLQALATVSH
jgi:hypothetical protein